MVEQSLIKYSSWDRMIEIIVTVKGILSLTTPKGKMIEKLVEGMTRGNLDNLLDNVTENIQWTIVGHSPIQGKDVFIKAIEAAKTGEAKEYKELNFANTITHGITAAVDGTYTVIDKSGEENTTSFCHVFRFNKFKDGIIKEITSYMIENTSTDDLSEQLNKEQSNKDQLKLPRIEGHAIDLRYAQESDLNAYYTMLQDEELTRLTGSHGDFTREGIEAWIQKIGVPHEDRVDFIIIVKDTNELVGEVVLNDFDSVNRSANIRIAIQGSNHRGKGYGTEAMIHMLRYGFETLKLHRIHLGVYTFNPRAIHVYEKIGFQREGLQRDVLNMDGEYHDMIMMAMLEDEFRSLHGSH